VAAALDGRRASSGLSRPWAARSGKHAGARWDWPPALGHSPV